jgi:hypothetical protein
MPLSLQKKRSERRSGPWAYTEQSNETKLHRRIPDRFLLYCDCVHSVPAFLGCYVRLRNAVDVVLGDFPMIYQLPPFDFKAWLKSVWIGLVLGFFVVLFVISALLVAICSKIRG